MNATLSIRQETPSDKTYITWEQFARDCACLLSFIKRVYPEINKVYGVPTGGCFVAQRLCMSSGFSLLDVPDDGCLVVDDILDSGKTMSKYPKSRFHRAALYVKPTSPKDGEFLRFMCAGEKEGWIVFPWEQNHPSMSRQEDGPTDAVIRLLEYVGEDPNRDGLRDTPRRVLKALAEMTDGTRLSEELILSTQFDLDHDEMIYLRGVPFVSLCEHHMMPFSGRAHVAYIPQGGKVVGLSKLARLVQCYSKRLQIQERMTGQIADALMKYLNPLGSACIVEAEHSCMSCRGAKVQGAEFVTSALRGAFKDDPKARAEFMSLVVQKR